MIGSLIKTFVVDANFLAWGKQEKSREKYGCNVPWAILLDPTSACNLRCTGCWAANYGHGLNLSLDDIDSIIAQGTELGTHVYIYTGGEPLVRKGAVDLVRAIHETPGVDDVSLTTNGVLLPKYAEELAAAGLSRVNISLDTLDPEQFRYITRRGELHEAIDGIEAALAVGFDPVKVNAVTVRSLGQDFLAFAKMTIDRPLHMRFIEYMPVGESAGSHGCGWGREDVIPSEELFDVINERAKAEGLPTLVAAGDERPKGWGPARYFMFPGAQGTVGFISPLSRHFCSECNRLRMTADGKIRPCLFSDVEYDMRAALRGDGGDEAIGAVLMEALGAKPDDHHDKVGTERGMSQIGG